MAGAAVELALDVLDDVVVEAATTVFDLVTTDLGGTTVAVLAFVEVEVFDLVDDLEDDLVEDFEECFVEDFGVEVGCFDDTCELGTVELTEE